MLQEPCRKSRELSQKQQLQKHLFVYITSYKSMPRHANATGTLAVRTRITIRLAEVPKFAREEYHSDQVAHYSKFTELTFKALNLPSVIEFMEHIAENLTLKAVQVRILRMPNGGRKASPIQKEGRTHLVIEYRKGSFGKRRGFIDIYPDLIWPSRLIKPKERVGIRGFILNSAIKALIHEMLHQSGIHNEAEVRRLTDQLYKEFRRTSLSHFEEEFRPILKEWKRMEKMKGLR